MVAKRERADARSESDEPLGDQSASGGAGAIEGTVPDAGREAERAYLLELKSKSDTKRWGAAHSRSARGELSQLWSTPNHVLDETLEILRACELPDRYTLDVAASPGSAVAPNWYGPFHFLQDHRDALASGVSWVAPRGGSSWLNAPYGQIDEFAERAANHGGGPLMFLAFARTDTKWFQNWIIPYATATWFRCGRIRFVDPVTGALGEAAPAPSFVSLFGVDPERVLAPSVVGRWRLVVFPREARARLPALATR